MVYREFRFPVGRRLPILLVITWLAVVVSARAADIEDEKSKASARRIGREVAIERHLQDDEEFRISLPDLIAHGSKLFNANWTEQEGGGRPFTKGNGKALSDPTSPLSGMRSFNRISGPDANSCTGCHNAPFGIAGGGGDIVTNVFVLGQRFDFATFDRSDAIPTRGSTDERMSPVTLLNIGNSRATTGLFGAGYIEMLAREITEDLHAIRDSMKLGDTRELISKGVSFGKLTRRKDALWDVTQVVGLPRASIVTSSSADPPNLILRPWHQAGNVVSLGEFSNNAFNQHHGIQTTERFGVDTDPDGDGVMNEMTRADVTAVSVFQAVMAVPGRVIPNDPEIEAANLEGERLFERIGCASCHIPALPLMKKSWIYTEPNPYNPPTNLRPGTTQTLAVNLNDQSLPSPRLIPEPGGDVVMVPVFSDLKLHDITDSEAPQDVESLDMNQTVWSDKFHKGNRRFLTKRLWGCANEPPFFHHGLYTTLRQSVLGHAGEALESRKQFQNLSSYEQNALIEFLKSLQVLPLGTKHLVVDEKLRPKVWPPIMSQEKKIVNGLP